MHFCPQEVALLLTVFVGLWTWLRPLFPTWDAPATIDESLSDLDDVGAEPPP